jgi:hypothetical protein
VSTEALTLALGAAKIHDVYGCAAPYDKTDGLCRLWRRIQLDELLIGSSTLNIHVYRLGL